jgi:hypothetical protein
MQMRTDNWITEFCLDFCNTEISKSRNVSVEKLNEITNGLLARTPEMAKAQKLVDIIAYEDVYHNDIRKKLDVARTKSIPFQLWVY